MPAGQGLKRVAGSRVSWSHNPAQGALIGLIARGTEGPLHTHGRLASRAATYSLQLWAAEHRGALMAGTLAIVAFVTTLIVGCKPLARVYQTAGESVRLDEPDRAG